MVGELYAEDGPRCRSESFPIGKAQTKIDSSLWHSRAEELSAEARDVVNHLAYSHCLPLIDGGVEA